MSDKTIRDEEGMKKILRDAQDEDGTADFPLTAGTPKLIALARAEREFLESLLPAVGNSQEAATGQINKTESL